MLPRITEGIKKRAYHFVSHDQVQLDATHQRGLSQFRCEYDSLPVDAHLNNGEGERSRRYARLAIDPETLQMSRFPHAPFFQSAKFDALYGDIHRNFAPATETILNNVFLMDLIRSDFQQFPIPKTTHELYEVSVHIIRIAASPHSEIGRPAPEGIHQDGYHFGAVHLMNRQNLTGAQSRVYDLNKQRLDAAYLLEPMDSVLMDDRRVFHSVEPFTATDTRLASYRDILILLFQPISESPQKVARPVPLAI